MTLTPEEKNATMSAERAFLTKLLESALRGNFGQLKQVVDEYCLKHPGVTAPEVLSQFRDGQRRTAVHFACQSIPSHKYEQDIIDGIFSPGWLPASSVQTMLRMKDMDGLTPLMLAAQVPDREIAEKRALTLLRACCETSSNADGAKSSKLGLARSRAGAAPLHYAAGAGASAVAIRAIYEAGQIAVKTSSLRGGTPLHWVCATSPPKDYAESIIALLDCDADINASHIDDSQMIPPPLIMALAAGNDRHAQCLVEEAGKRGIDFSASLDFKLPGQLSLYHIAADMNMVGTLAVLLNIVEKDTILEMKDSRGLSPLDLAAQEGHVGCVLLLLPSEKQTEEEAIQYIEDARSKKVDDTITASVAPSTEKVGPTSDDEQSASIEAQAQSEAASIAASASEISDESKKTAKEKKEVGNAHFGKHEWASAVDLYTQAISLDPTDATFYSNRSACYIHLKEPEKALHDATIARSLRPEWSKAAYRMAVSRLELGRFEDAAVSAWEGLQQDQDNDELKTLLQKCVKKGRKDFLGSNV